MNMEVDSAASGLAQERRLTSIESMSAETLRIVRDLGVTVDKLVDKNNDTAVKLAVLEVYKADWLKHQNECEAARDKHEERIGDLESSKKVLMAGAGAISAVITGAFKWFGNGHS